MKPHRRAYSRRQFVGNVGRAAVLSLLPYTSIEAGNGKIRTSAQHRLLSANIRVALPEDEAKGVGWNVRKKICAEVIRAKKPDIICLQEVLKIQDADMKGFFPDYYVFGFEGPDMDTYPEGYHGIAKNIILFSKERYKYISSGCYWLSEMPLIAGSKSWGSARARHCNWVRLRDKDTCREFRVLNAHLDHLSQTARERQIQMILDESAQYQADFPQLFAGDFNADATNEAIRKVKSAGWTDTYTSVRSDVASGFTFHGFQGDKKKPGNNSKIDFIFSKGLVQSTASEIVKDQIGDIYPSDHYFIFTDVIF